MGLVRNLSKCAFWGELGIEILFSNNLLTVMSANLYIILPFYFFLAWGIDQKYKIQIVPQKNRKKSKNI